MSCVLNGQVIDTELSKNARGGTEMMRSRLIHNVPSELLQGFAIHFSRPRQLYKDVINILYCHDLAEDGENDILKNGGWTAFDYFVFVSVWQRDHFIKAFSIPYSKCFVIPNAIETEHTQRSKPDDVINFVYHTTPHRGLELLYPVFDALTKTYDNLHLDVFSSFEIYGWESRNGSYEALFKSLKKHPQITYHGTKSNQEVLDSLEKSHVFLYPCIWKETSCIAMIEAMQSGCLVIHPNYGALPETSGGRTISYDFTEDVNAHANTSYAIAKQVLDMEKANKGWINSYTNKPEYSLTKTNSMSVFTNKWISILRHVNIKK
jgi:UDP-glucose:(glucosyl)LPS alpha-1,2-glucosyltransferase